MIRTWTVADSKASAAKTGAATSIREITIARRRFVVMSVPPHLRRRERVGNIRTAKAGRMRRIPEARHDLTGLLHAWTAGDADALARLIPVVEAELHRIAQRCMRSERVGHSLQATALVNEAYLRLVDVRRVQWQDRAHFLAMSARLMRRVLVDHARARGYQKRGGAGIRVTLVDGMG